MSSISNGCIVNTHDYYKGSLGTVPSLFQYSTLSTIPDASKFRILPTSVSVCVGEDKHSITDLLKLLKVPFLESDGEVALSPEVYTAIVNYVSTAGGEKITLVDYISKVLTLPK